MVAVVAVVAVQLRRAIVTVEPHVRQVRPLVVAGHPSLCTQSPSMTPEAIAIAS